MSPELIYLFVAIALGFYVAWNIGANDVANAMGTSVGSGALTLKKAVICAAILEFAGAFLLGSHVSETIGEGIINPTFFANEPRVYVCGMLASLLAAGVWLQVASYFGWPVSTTHSIIGAVVGFAVSAAGIHAVYWGEVSSIVGSWLLSPIMGGVIAFLVFNIIRSRIFNAYHPIAAAKRLTPFFVFFVFFILSLVIFYQGVAKLHLDLSFGPAAGLAFLVGAVTAGISYFLVRRIPEIPMAEHGEASDPQTRIGLERALRHLQRAQVAASGELQQQIAGSVQNIRHLSQELERTAQYESLEPQFRSVEKIFTYLQIISACFMAFAHGANDVANAIGPLASVISVITTGQILTNVPIPTWILVLGGLGIVVGLATWGWRVIETVGRRITELTPTRGFAAEFAAAVTIVLASRLGLPISTTHTLVGAVLGVGLARGIGAINLSTIRDIVVSWVVTVPVGAVLSILFYHLFVRIS